MFCPDCGAALIIESGLLYCPAEDAYKGEADEENENQEPAPQPYYVSFGFTDDQVARGEDFGGYDFPNLRRDR